jgi:L-ascorbate metabolism protein UlaG (beta-lactamase superfamily)
MPGLPSVNSLLPGGKAALRLAAGTASLAAGGWVLGALRETPAALGAGAGAIHAVAEGSPNYRGGVFRNLDLDAASALRLDVEENRQLLFDMIGGSSASPPRDAIPLAEPPKRRRAHPLSATWYGHASALLEIDGYRLLTDPVWSRRCSPSRSAGPQRLHPPPLPLEALPALDAVLISHDHYDHLDMDTVRSLARSQRCPFIVPLGVGAHLRHWGIPPTRVIELDWSDETLIGDLKLVCTPARHHSGRFMARNNTLWASWAVIGPAHRAYFGGDTGYTRSFTDIGAEHGPFDLTLLPIGAYNKAWPDIHMNPEEAVQAHRDLNGEHPGVLVPIHWATFRLAPHPWAEPAERLVDAAAAAGVDIAVPKPGGRVIPSRPVSEQWWRL